jgi:hypothetical protein
MPERCQAPQATTAARFAVVIHYHGTPVGGPRDGVARFLVGRHALVPFARPDDLGAVLEYAQSFVLDNSAFSYWQSGQRVPFDDYVEWCSTVARHPAFDWCLIPDLIDGTEDENYRWVRDWLRLGLKFKGVPVWHLHESLGYLDWLVSHTSTRWRSAVRGNGPRQAPPHGGNAWRMP